MNIYVGNLSREFTEGDLREAFEAFGEVTSAKIIKDKYSGESKGFGFVEMEPEAAAKAIEALDGTDFEGHILRVNEARDRGARPPRRSW